MPDTRKHRGTHPEDDKLFSPANHPHLRASVADLSWLLTRGYAEKAALKLVGDRYNLPERQRLAVQRSACSDQALRYRQEHEIGIDQINNKPILIDTYNLLILIESALAGAYIFKGRDNCYRDLAGIHGNYRKVEETVPAIERIGNFLAKYHCGQVTWLIDQPVSNSGRLKTLLAEVAKANNWEWHIELMNSPDSKLESASSPVVTTDGPVLNNVKLWVNLGGHMVDLEKLQAKIVDLSQSSI